MVDIDKNLKEKFGEKNPFEVPQNYFEEFSAKMMEQIEKEEVKTVEPDISIGMRLKPYLYMAASFIALFLIARQVIPTQTEPSVLVEKNNIVISDDYDVLFSQIDEYALVEFAIEEDIPSLAVTDED